MKLDFYLTSLTKINLKQIKDINLRPEIVKLLEKKQRENLLNIGLGNNLGDITPKVCDKGKIKWDYIKPKNFCTA